MLRRVAALGAWLLPIAAWAQLDCGAGGALCETVKYGLGDLPGFREGGSHGHAEFGPPAGGVSYAYARGGLVSGDADCGPERDFVPYPGQIFLRERIDCTPTGTGPACSGGANDGQACHLLPPDGSAAGYVNPFRAAECPDGSCVDGGGGCRVEIPDSDGGGVTPAALTSDAVLSLYLHAQTSTGPAVVRSQSAQTWGGSSHGVCVGGPTPASACRTHVDCGSGGSCSSACSSGPTPGAPCTSDASCGSGSCDVRRGTCQLGSTPGALCLQDEDCGPGGTCPIAVCSDANFRLKPSTGTRYLLPASRGGDGARTFVRWDYGQVDRTLEVRVALSTALRTHGDDSTTCCSGPGCSGPISGGPPLVYPLLAQLTCAVPNRVAFEDNLTSDWIFSADCEHFYTDPEFVVPGQLVGVCAADHRPCTAPAANARCSSAGVPYDCCTGPGQGACGEECGPADACDLREPGHRSQVVNGRDAFGDPRPTVCGASFYVLRGTRDRGCTLAPPFPAPGDPGPDCGLPTFGRDRRYDGNCDGVADFADGCPYLAEWGQDADADGDCAGGVGSACRLDECECGDQTGDGRVDVSDLVAINLAIFGAVPARRLCDANGDFACDVSDIVAANREIFVPGSSTCAHVTSPD